MTRPPISTFAAAMNKVPLRVQHSLYQDETSDHVHWHINATHYLEEWGDGRAFDGTCSIVQPLIAPLYNGKSEYEFISAAGWFARRPRATTLFASTGRARCRAVTSTPQWRKALNDGFVANTALPAKSVSAKGGNIPASNNGGNGERWRSCSVAIR